MKCRGKPELFRVVSRFPRYILCYITESWLPLGQCILLTMKPLSQSLQKDGARSKGKGRRVCLGGRICSISCRASCFASVDLEEKVEFILFFQIDEGKIATSAKEFNKFCPPNRSDDLYLCHCLHPSSMQWMLPLFLYIHVKQIQKLCYVELSRKETRGG